jgi:hypothetical protein
MDIIEKKEHLTKQGFYKILSIKSLFPKGLSDKLLEVYSKENIMPTIKPVFEPSEGRQRGTSKSVLAGVFY